MRILVVGGTRFVGRHLVEQAVDAGHDVTLLHRGETGCDAFPELEHRHADRNGDLGVLDGSSWDAVVDTCAYVPRQVHHLADALGGGSGRYVFISSVSAYADPDGPGFTEDADLAELDDPTVEEVTNETYGGLKVLCERVARERFEEPLIVRPTYVVGPHDHTGRFNYWVLRLARGGEVLAPGPRDAPVQVIDARDQGRWIVRAVEAGATGAFHTVHPEPPFTFEDLLTTVAEVVAPTGTTLTWVDEAFLLEQGISSQQLPLWSGGEEAFVLAADPSKARAAGLAPRPLERTVADTYDWARDAADARAAGIGLDQERERELLDAWHG